MFLFVGSLGLRWYSVATSIFQVTLAAEKFENERVNRPRNQLTEQIAKLVEKQKAMMAKGHHPSGRSAVKSLPMTSKAPEPKPPQPKQMTVEQMTAVGEGLKKIAERLTVMTNIQQQMNPDPLPPPQLKPTPPQHPPPDKFAAMRNLQKQMKSEPAASSAAAAPAAAAAAPGIKKTTGGKAALIGVGTKKASSSVNIKKRYADPARPLPPRKLAQMRGSVASG